MVRQGGAVAAAVLAVLSRLAVLPVAGVLRGVGRLLARGPARPVLTAPGLVPVGRVLAARGGLRVTRGRVLLAHADHPDISQPRTGGDGRAHRTPRRAAVARATLAAYWPEV